MTNINLRLYADQIYPNISYYLSKYISPEIKKEEFISMYKSGIIKLNHISLKESLSFHPQIKLEEAFISTMEINIPDEKENFGISIKDIKCLLTISEINENEVEKLLIEDKKKLIEEFINYAVKKVEKKDGPSFLDNLIKSVVEKIINGLIIDIQNLELKIKAKNKDNIYFVFLIDNFIYNFSNGIQIKNINLIYQDDSLKINIIEKFSIIIDIIFSESNNKPNEIKLMVSDNILLINQKIILEFLNIFDIFDRAKYNKIYTKYKKLILFHKPKNKENVKKYYKSLWIYAIRAVIKLMKYVKNKKYNIFDLPKFSQIKIIEKYLENNRIDNIILSDDTNTLKATKNRVEKKVLDNKNSNVLANAFNFFFGAKKEEKNNELTEEEKQLLEEIYKDSNIYKYLNNEIEKTSINFNIIIEKIKSFFSNFTCNFEIKKFQFDLQNKNSKYNVNLFINTLKFLFSYINNQWDLEFIINDIGYNNNTSFFNKRNDTNAISINIDRDNYVDLKFGFQNIEIKVEGLLGIFILLQSIGLKKNHKIFHENFNILKHQKQGDNPNQIVKTLSNFSFTNNLKITNIPSLSILTKNNKIELNIFNYSLKPNSIYFSINLNDSYGKILQDLSLNIIRVDKNFISKIETPVEIVLQKETLSLIIMNYFEYNKEIGNEYKPNNNDFNILNKDSKLFDLNITVDKYIDLGNIDLNKYNLEFSLNKIDFKILKETKILEDSFLLDDLKLSYIKKNLIINYNNCLVTLAPESNLFSLPFNSEKNLTQNDFKFEKKENVNKEIKSSYIIKNIIEAFNFKGITTNIILNSSHMVFSLKLKNINIYESKDKSSIFLLNDNLNCNVCLTKLKNKSNILKCEKQIIIEYKKISNIIKTEIDSINFKGELKSLFEIYNNFSFLLKGNNDNINQKKIKHYGLDLNINNSKYEIGDKYKIGISKVNINNYKENKNILSNFDVEVHKFFIKNNINLIIIHSDLFQINFNLSSNIENQMNIYCPKINFNLSQDDVSFFSIFFKTRKEYYKFNSTELVKNKKNLLLDSVENNLLDNQEKNQKNYQAKNTVQILPNENKKKSLNLIICFQNIDLSFCKNNSYANIYNLLMENVNIKSSVILGNEIFLSNNYQHNLWIQSLDLIYYYNDDEKCNLLSKRKINLNEKQVDMIYSNNNIQIILNNNEINLRIDAILRLYYYFRENDSLEKAYNSINDAFEIKKYFKLFVNNSRFQLNTSFEGKENLFLDINSFNINYNNMNSNFPYGNYEMFFDKIFANIIHKNNTRKLFKTGEKFLEIKLNYFEELISSNITIRDLLINLSYRDFVSFLRAYQFYLKLINISINRPKNLKIELDKEKKIVPNSGQTPDSNSKDKNRVLAGELIFNNINITLIDDSKGSYQPFLNFTFENITLNYDPDNSFSSIFLFRLSSYNYIACVWEPVIEKLPIKTNGIFSDKYEFNIFINCLLINLSDMAISFTLVTFNNWLTKLELKTKKFENKEIIMNNKYTKKISEEQKNSTKITNNQIINYTGIKLDIIHNEKQILCPPLEKVELDNSNLNEFEGLDKPKHMTLIYDNEHKFEIPLEKIIALMHNINDKLFIISENSLSDKKTINISLYSPLIFKNKTPFTLKVEFSNQKYQRSEIIIVPNSICGFPLNLFIPNTYFCFFLFEENNNKDNRTEDFSLDNILNSKNIYKKQIQFYNKSLTMKITKQFGNLRILNIYSEYNIVNCLPCKIDVTYFNQKYTLEKCSQHYITENYYDKLFIEFSINTEFGLFTTERINLIDLSNKNSTNYFLTFKNNKGYKFSLPYIFKRIDEEKVFIIYSELILYNKSGLNLSISYKISKNIVCFGVQDKINLITSNIDYQEEKLQFRCNNYFTRNIKIHELIQITNNIRICMLDSDDKNPFDIIIKKKSSYIKILNNPNFKENLISIVFTILPMCRIYNLLSTKKILICDYENSYNKNKSIVIPPLRTANFQFFNKGYKALLGITALNLNANNYKTVTKFQFNISIYTLIADNYVYNLDIKKNPSSGCLDVYIFENNIKNSQTILENLSNDAIIICQKNFEKDVQILYQKDIAPLNIYDFLCKDFIFETSNSRNEINLNNFKNCEKDIALNKQTVAIFQDNGIKMKITFYPIEKYTKAKSSLIYIRNNIYIKTIYISIIGDNEIKHPKLTNYKRNEFLLFYITNFKLDLNIKKTIGILNKYFIKMKLISDKLRIYNQLSTEGKFACILKNEETPCIYLENEINYYQNQKILNIESQDIKINKLKLGIDPEFFRIFFTFYDNVLYRMDLTYFNINKIFLNNYVRDPKKLINKYIKGRILINAIKLTYPELDVDYELAEKGLENLLKERIACSDFYIWLAKGLVGSEQNLSIENSNLTFTNGTIVQYCIWLYYVYLSKIEENLSSVGIQGFFGQVKSFITMDFLNEEKNKNIEKDRIRETRPFYGKFKYFREYDKDDAILIRNTLLYNNNGILSKYYPTKIIKEKKSFFLFTTITMFHIDSIKYELMWNVDYFSIKNITVINNIVKVFYNHKIDNYDSCTFKCENDKIAKEVAESLNEETLKNKENILDIS